MTTTPTTPTTPVDSEVGADVAEAAPDEEQPASAMAQVPTEQRASAVPEEQHGSDDPVTD